MILNREPIKNWFGFTRRERRSSFSLLLILIAVIGVRYTIPESRIAIEDVTFPDSVAENHSDLAINDSAFPVKSSSYTKVKKSAFQKAGTNSSQQKPKIDINASYSATLVKLPGIGPVLSARIIKYKRMLGGFASIDQLKEVYGLPAETFDLIKERVFADSTAVTKININSAGYKELSHIHYFTKYELTAILKYREINGRIKNISDLIDNKLITEETAFKVRPYLKYAE